MTSHKDRLSAVNRKGFSLPRSYFGSQSGYSNSHIPPNEKKLHRSQTERSNSGDSTYQDPLSPEYLNMSQEKPEFDFVDNKRSHKSLDKQPLKQSQTQISNAKLNGTSKSHINMLPQGTLSNNPLLYKSQSLNALKTKEPSKILAKSSIQQEFHDKRVQHHLRGMSYGKAKRPCQIATIMFIIFGLLFIVGLTLICLTYIYKNINFSLDKGEMIGPVIMAGSFVFLGVGIKFIYDAHRIARKERVKISYQGYNRNYVGLKSGRKEPTIANEKLISGTATDNGLTRIPNKIKPPVNDQRTLGVSSQKVYEPTRDDSEL